MQRELKILVLITCVFYGFILVSCSQPTPAPVNTAVSATDTPEIEPTQEPTKKVTTPTSIPPTPTQKPTEVSYDVVIPIETMQNQNPWLPMNKSEVPGSAYLIFNFNSKTFKNRDARAAIAAATDKEVVLQMAQKYYEVEPKIATSLTPPQILGVDLTNKVGISYDPQKAQESLLKAGYKPGMKKPVIKLLMWVSGTRQGYRYLLAQEFAKMWEKNLDLKTEIKTSDNPGKAMESNDWDIYMIIWGADLMDPDNFLGELFSTGKEVNLGKFSSKPYESIINEAKKAKTPKERQEHYIQAEKKLCEDYIALVPLYSVKNFKR